jgi:hypothetical protein
MKQIVDALISNVIASMIAEILSIDRAAQLIVLLAYVVDFLLWAGCAVSSDTVELFTVVDGLPALLSSIFAHSQCIIINADALWRFENLFRWVIR